jgi:quercetin dioxygenase-like cupin family protein
VTVGGTTLGRITLEPGWHWAEHVKPIAGTELCMVPHLQYIVSGRLRIRPQAGEEYEVGAGDAGWIPPGHDAWVIGDESLVAIEVMGAAEYAKPK